MGKDGAKNSPDAKNCIDSNNSTESKNSNDSAGSTESKNSIESKNSAGEEEEDDFIEVSEIEKCAKTIGKLVRVKNISFEDILVSDVVMKEFVVDGGWGFAKIYLIK
jgi:hypothetical protein